MSCRRYLYLVVDRFVASSYPLRRIDSSSLFFPATQKVTPEARTDARLPPPCISFVPLDSTRTIGMLDFFAMFGHGAKKSLIAGADEAGNTFMYNVYERTIRNHIRLNEPKHGQTISLAVGDALYVMEEEPHPGKQSFEALTYDHKPGYMPAWRWHCLKPPPYVLEPSYSPTCVSAHTVVGGSHIWISTPGIGTYSFDTTAGTWSKVAKWVLPFHGRGDYFPEYDLWLGFSAQNSMLCSMELNSASKPVVHSVLEAEEDVPEGDCFLMDSYLVHLGSGKFCIAKFYQKKYFLPPVKGFETHIVPQTERFLDLTGFEMDLSGPGGKLRMRKHKSRRYVFQAMTKGWVF